MDREILFRGKRVDNGEWIEGFYHNVYTSQSHSSDRKVTHHHIYTQDFDVIVDGDTVGQFTGLTDKNGKKIFEGDIVEYEFDEIGKQKAIIYWNFAYAGFLLNPLDNFQFTRTEDGRVVGNIYDNPELLGGGNEKDKD